MFFHDIRLIGLDYQSPGNRVHPNSIPETWEGSRVFLFPNNNINHPYMNKKIYTLYVLLYVSLAFLSIFLGIACIAYGLYKCYLALFDGKVLPPDILMVPVYGIGFITLGIVILKSDK